MTVLEQLAADIAVGESLPPRTIDSISRSDIARYAGATGDFHPLHCDDAYAQAAGFPSVFAHGMLAGGILSGYVTSLVGIGNVRRFAVQIKGQVWPGDSLICRGVVSSKASHGEHVELCFDLEVLNQHGAVVLTGTATAGAVLGS